MQGPGARQPKALAALILGIAIIAASNTVVFACSCLEYSTIPEAIATSDIVLRGRVIEVRAHDERDQLRVAVVEVIAYWKDTTELFGPIIEILDPPPGVCSSALGSDFAVGREWIVFAEIYSWGTTTDECVRTMTWRLFGFDYGSRDYLGTPIVVLANAPTGWGTLKALFGS